jgi:DNA-binding transcriptional LysR family regulator
MDRQQLAYFRAAGRLQNVSRAAEELGMTQPALSRSLARLEAELGAELFARAGRNVRLTPAGEAFLPYAERALEAIDEGRRAIADVGERADRRISLGFLHTLGAELVPTLVRNFETQEGAVQFEFVQSSSVDLRLRLLAGELDLALTAGPLEDDRVRWQELEREDVVLLVPRRHPLASESVVPLAQVAGEPFISYKPGFAMRELTEDLCAAAGFRPRIVFEGEESNTVGGFVGAGLGVAIVPGVIPPAKGTIRLRIADPNAVRRVGIAWSTSRYLSRAARAFREFVRRSRTDA